MLSLPRLIALPPLEFNDSITVSWEPNRFHIVPSQVQWFLHQQRPISGTWEKERAPVSWCYYLTFINLNSFQSCWLISLCYNYMLCLDSLSFIWYSFFCGLSLFFVNGEYKNFMWISILPRPINRHFVFPKQHFNSFGQTVNCLFLVSKHDWKIEWNLLSYNSSLFQIGLSLVVEMWVVQQWLWRNIQASTTKSLFHFNACNT